MDKIETICQCRHSVFWHTNVHTGVIGDCYEAECDCLGYSPAKEVDWEKLKEDIAIEIGQHTENCPWDVCSKSEKEAARKSADFILAKLRQAGFLQLDSDQSLPEVSSFQEVCRKLDGVIINVGSYEKSAQQDMLKARFRKVR